MTKTTELATTEMSEYRAQILAVQRVANDISIESAKELDEASNVLKMIADGEKAISSRKEEITRPLMTALASARDLFKPLELGFADAKKMVKSKMLAFQIEEESRITREQSKIEARVIRGTLRSDTAAGKLEKLGEAPKSGMRTVIKIRIVDAELIPRSYMIPDIGAITDAILHRDEIIPGAEKYEEKLIVVKR